MKKVLIIISMLLLVSCSSKIEEPEDDIKPPVIDNPVDERKFELTLNGDSILNLKVNEVYNESYATAYDSIDKEVEVGILSITFNNETLTNLEVDTSKIGVYKITYRAINSNNDIKTIARIINILESDEEVVDETKETHISINNEKILKKVFVNNNEELKNSVNEIKEGTAIIIKSGNYNNLDIEIKDNGTEEKPIFIIAETPGEVFVTGISRIKISGDYINLSGITFKDGHPVNDKGVIDVYGSHNRINNNYIFKYEDDQCHNDTSTACDKWVSIKGQHNEIDYNKFEGKSTSGALLTVWRDPGKADYHHIHNNYFKDYSNPEGISNGLEAIRIGTSNDSQSDSFTIVEDNIFEEMNGEVEMISIKSGKNIVRGNLILKSQGLITSRHGKNNIIENNVIIQDGVSNSGGIRVYDSGHIIRNNYISGVNTSSNTRGAIVIHSGINEVGVETTLNKQWTSNNVLVENNTIIDSRQSFLFDDKYTYQPKDITIKNNFIDAKSNSIFRYDTNGLNTLNEGTIEFVENLLVGNSLNGGNGNILKTNFDGEYKNSYSNTTTKDGIIYSNDNVGAKNLVKLSYDDVSTNY